MIRKMRNAVALAIVVGVLSAGTYAYSADPEEMAWCPCHDHYVRWACTDNGPCK